MKTPTGSAIVEAITQILERQNREGQEAKQFQAIRLLSTFSQDHGIPPQTAAISTLSRLIRKLDRESIRQIRSMSDSLLNKDERELESELFALRDQLMPIEARIHQVKTKAAFVSSVLRPFSPKYTSMWFQDRDDIDVDRAKAQIEQLERMTLRDSDDLIPWARGVADVFEQVVVYRGADVADLYARPTGTVSDKSSKTYLQAWNAFIERSGEEAWSIAVGAETVARSVSSSPKSSRKSALISLNEIESDELPGLDQDIPEQYQESFSMMMAPPSRSPGMKRIGAPPKEKSSKVIDSRGLRSNKPSSQFIQIFIESKIDSSAQATRRWESKADFKQSLQKWLDTLPVIWGPAADQFVAKVSVKTATGESDLTLPSLTVSEAAERLTQAVEMQSE